ncbi:MAG: tyrosine-type recombinase/integrase [Clostridia bacterium]|nr:tyrosine-type recombinase/integrase [Clostridia bacterium]
MTIANQLERFRQNLALREKSRATQQKYLREAEQLLAFLDGRQPTPELIVKYKEALRNARSPKTVNVALCAVNSFLRAMGRDDCRVRLLRVQRCPFTQSSRELAQAEYERLLCAAKPRDRLYLLLQTLCATGMRVSELRFVTVEAARAGRAVVFNKGKSRVILFSKALRERLLRYAKARSIEGGFLFRTRSGRPLDRRNIWRDMKRLAALASVEPSKIFPHNLRHLFARAYYAAERNLALLADILGHASVETTRIYVAASEREHIHTLEQLHLVAAE